MSWYRAKLASGRTFLIQAESVAAAVKKVQNKHIEVYGKIVIIKRVKL